MEPSAIFNAVGAIGGVAGFGSALASWRLSKRIARRDIALEVRNLNNSLNEDVSSMQQLHQQRLQARKASYSYHGLLYSNAMEIAQTAWNSDGEKLGAAIGELDAPNSTFDTLGEADLEARLLRLKSIERTFQREREIANKWDLEHNQLYQRAQDSSPLR